MNSHISCMFETKSWAYNCTAKPIFCVHQHDWWVIGGVINYSPSKQSRYMLATDVNSLTIIDLCVIDLY